MNSSVEILQKYWGHAAFRPMQEDIINSVLDKKDTLALLPTGGGKSVCFQIPALAQEGICIVVSPLIALMKDQVENLIRKGIPAVAIFSGMNRREIDIALDNCIYGKIKFLYMSPERLGTEIALERIKKMKINLLAVDEAHCISQWGYDFRPSYLKIAEIRNLVPNAPVLALTATATPDVRKDIQEKLLFKNNKVFVQSFERRNLSYVVFYEENKMQRLRNILAKVSGSAIIYLRSRNKTKEISDALNRYKISADFYHAGLNTISRNKKQDDWIKGKTRVMVATNAFGMGIDKPDVRVVVHLDFPDTIEAYYQEAGRAGRDGSRSYAVLLYNNSDLIGIDERIEKKFPSIEEIKKVYQSLANYFQLASGSGEGASFDFDISQFCSSYGFQAGLAFNCLSVLASEGYLALSDAIMLPSRVHFNSQGEDLYNFELQNEKYVPLIKSLLRNSEGLFSGYNKIQESIIAKQIIQSNEEVKSQLLHLAKIGLLSYIPAKDNPQITFTRPRADTKHLELNPEQLTLRKKNAEKKIRAVENYAVKTSKCRSMMLLEYLGEETTQRCNTCDFCINRNKLELSDLEFNLVKEQVKNVLAEQSLTLEKIISEIKNINEDKALKVIEWLIDNRKLTYNKENKLTYEN